MARRAARKARLIAIEGTRGRDVQPAAAKLWSRLRVRGARGGISAWDASGIFHELCLGKRKHLALSPRTLVLLYAADLAFRLRWEIRPTLASDQIVVAAPYIETAVAFGVASDLPRPWLARLFAFAPPPDTCYRVKQSKSAARGKEKRLDGFGEFCRAVLPAGPVSADRARLLQNMASHLEGPEGKIRYRRLTARALAAERP